MERPQRFPDMIAVLRSWYDLAALPPFGPKARAVSLALGRGALGNLANLGKHGRALRPRSSSCLWPRLWVSASPSSGPLHPAKWVPSCAPHPGRFCSSQSAYW